MSFDEILQLLTTSDYLYLVIAVCATLIVFIVINASRKKRISDRIERSQVKINSLNSHSFTVDIAKMEAITRINESFSDTADSCRKDFNRFQEIIKTVLSLLQDCTENLGISKYNRCEVILKEIEPQLAEGESICERLKDVLNTILNQNSMQRIRINELKSEFHDIKTIVNNNPSDYAYCWKAVDQTTDHISHLFTEFEQIMEVTKYEDAALKATQISEAVDSLNILVSNLPALISLARTAIPEQMSQMDACYKVALQYDTCLDNLNYDNVVSKLKDDIDNCLKDLKECNIDTVNERLIDIQSRINAMMAGIEEEKNSYKQLVRVRSDCEEILKKVCGAVDRMENGKDNMFSRYNMNALRDEYSALKTKAASVKESFNVLMSTCESKTIPSSTLLLTFDEIRKDIGELDAQCTAVIGSVDENSLQENRIRELVARFMVVLNESKENIRMSHLPNISSKVHSDIEEAEKHIAQINGMLNNSVLNMNDIKEKAQTAQTLISSLYKNVTNVIDTAKDIENFIVLCNKYRPYYPDVDSALYLAELAYRNGEYTKACKMSATALEKIDPKTARALLNSIERKLQANKEAEQ